MLKWRHNLHRPPPAGYTKAFQNPAVIRHFLSEILMNLGGWGNNGAIEEKSESVSMIEDLGKGKVDK